MLVTARTSIEKRQEFVRASIKMVRSWKFLDDFYLLIYKHPNTPRYIVVLRRTVKA